MGKRLKTIIDSAIENHYLNINKKIIGDLSNINDKNVVILNANEKEKTILQYNENSKWL